MKVVNELKRIMKERRLSLENVARELDVSSRTVFRWIHRESKPTGTSLTLLEKFTAKATIENYDEFYKGEGDIDGQDYGHIDGEGMATRVVENIGRKVKWNKGRKGDGLERGILLGSMEALKRKFSLGDDLWEEALFGEVEVEFMLDFLEKYEEGFRGGYESQYEFIVPKKK